MSAKRKADSAESPFDTFDTFAASGGGVSADTFLDLSEIPETVQYEVLPAGLYDAIIDSAEFGNSQRSGNPMLTWTFKLPLDDGKSRTMFYHTVLTPEALPRLKRMLVRLAPHANREFDFAQFNPNEAAELFVGVPCRVRLRTQTYEGQMRNSVSDVLPPSEENIGNGFGA